MIRITLLIILTIIINPIFGQSTVEKKYPKILWSSNDSFAVRFSNFRSFAPSFRVSENDTTDMGSDGAPGLYVMIYLGKDSAKVTYQNLPLDEVNWINVESPKGKTVFRLHFNRINAAFSRNYIQKNTNSVRFEVPEVFELANIIWTLSPSGQRANNLNKEGAYYEKMTKYFKPYLTHPLFRKLDFNVNDYMEKYYDFRDNSFAFSFNKKNKLVWGQPYYYVNGNDKEFNSLFKKLIPLIEDFAEKSNYRSFYKSNQLYYDQLKKEEFELMPVKNVWQWLENEFSGKFESCEVIFSPLIGASHSTQNYSDYIDEKWFRQSVMFVCGPSIFDADEKLNEKQREGLASGIVFTEIDHNYVNPVSSKYETAIDSIFSKREIWTSSGGDTKFYDSPESVFNEYMTHAVFCLYVLDKFDSATSDFIIKNREALMVEHRHYIKFREFDKRLIELKSQNKELKVSDLFPKIIDWCKTQK